MKKDLMTRMEVEIGVFEKIVAEMEQSLFDDDSVIFFDPNMAVGQFLSAVRLRLIKTGKSDDVIKSRLHGVCDHPALINIARNVHKLEGNFMVGNFLEMEIPMKFENIICNPPYDGVNELYQKFFIKSKSLLEENGQMIFICPNSFLVNKKKLEKNAELSKQIVVEHKTSVKMVKNPFDASLSTGVSIITVKNTESDNLIEFTDIEGRFFQTKVEGINDFGFNPKYYAELVAKSYAYLKPYDKNSVTNLRHKIVHNPNTNRKKQFYGDMPKEVLEGAWIPAVHGGEGIDNFNLLKGKNRLNFGDYQKSKGNNEKPAGMSVAVYGTDQENFYDFLNLAVTRAVISLGKIERTVTTVIGFIPCVDFSKKWDNESLAKEMGFSNELLMEIERVFY